MSAEANYSRRSGPRDRHLRVSDAEREAVAAILRREHLAGRLDNEEFDERVTRCLAAKTYSELDELIGDLPTGEPETRRVVGSRRWRRSRPPFVFLPIVVAAIVFSHGGAAWLLVPLFFCFAVRPFFWRGVGGRALGARKTGYPG